MMNEREILILQIKQGTCEWEDITRQVQCFDAQKNACRIKYVGNANFYWKSWRDLLIYDKPVIVDTTGKIVYCDKVPVKGVYQIIAFNEYAKLFFALGNTKLVSRSDIKLVSDISQKSGIRITPHFGRGHNCLKRYIRARVCRRYPCKAVYALSPHDIPYSL